MPKFNSSNLSIFFYRRLNALSRQSSPDLDAEFVAVNQTLVDVYNQWVQAPNKQGFAESTIAAQFDNDDMRSLLGEYFKVLEQKAYEQNKEPIQVVDKFIGRIEATYEGTTGDRVRALRVGDAINRQLQGLTFVGQDDITRGNPLDDLSGDDALIFEQEAEPMKSGNLSAPTDPQTLFEPGNDAVLDESNKLGLRKLFGKKNKASGSSTSEPKPSETEAPRVRISGDPHPVYDPTPRSSGYLDTGAVSRLSPGKPTASVKAYNKYVGDYMADLIDTVGAYRQPGAHEVSPAWLDKVADLQSYFDGPAFRFSREIAISRQLGYFEPDLIQRLQGFRQGVENTVGHKLDLNVDSESVPTDVPGHTVAENVESMDAALQQASIYWDSLSVEQKAVAKSFGFDQKSNKTLISLRKQLGKNPAGLDDLSHKAFAEFIKLDKTKGQITRPDDVSARTTDPLDVVLPWVEELTPALRLQRLQDSSFEPVLLGGDMSRMSRAAVNQQQSSFEHAIATNIPGVDVGYDSSYDQADRAFKVLQAGLADKSSPDRPAFAKQVFTAGALAEGKSDYFLYLYGSDNPALVLGFTNIEGRQDEFEVLARTSRAGLNDDDGPHGAIKVSLGYNGSVDDALANTYHELSHAINFAGFSTHSAKGEPAGDHALFLTPNRRVVWGHGVEERTAVGSRFLGAVPFDVQNPQNIPIGWINENTFLQLRGLPATLLYAADTQSRQTTASKSFYIPEDSIPESLKGVTFDTKSPYFANQYEVFTYLNQAQKWLQRLRNYKNAMFNHDKYGMSEVSLRAVSNAYDELSEHVRSELPKLSDAAALGAYEFVQVHHHKINSATGEFESRSPESTLIPIYDIVGTVGQQLDDPKLQSAFDDNVRVSIRKYYTSVFADSPELAEMLRHYTYNIDPRKFRGKYTTDLSTLDSPFGMFSPSLTAGELRAYQGFAKSLGIPESIADTSTASPHDYLTLLAAFDKKASETGMTAEQKSQTLLKASEAAFTELNNGQQDLRAFVVGIHQYLQSADAEVLASFKNDDLFGHLLYNKPRSNTQPTVVPSESVDGDVPPLSTGGETGAEKNGQPASTSKDSSDNNPLTTPQDSDSHNERTNLNTGTDVTDSSGQDSGTSSRPAFGRQTGVTDTNGSKGSTGTSRPAFGRQQGVSSGTATDDTPLSGVGKVFTDAGSTTRRSGAPKSKPIFNTFTDRGNDATADGKFSGYAAQYLSELGDAVGSFRQTEFHDVTPAYLDKVAALQGYADGPGFRFAREISLSRRLGYFEPDLLQRLQSYRDGIEDIIGHKLSLSIDENTAPSEVPGQNAIENGMALRRSLTDANRYFLGLSDDEKAVAASFGFDEQSRRGLSSLNLQLLKNPDSLDSVAKQAFAEFIKLDKTVGKLSRPDDVSARESQSSKLKLLWVDDLTPALQLKRLQDDSFEPVLIGADLDRQPGVLPGQENSSFEHAIQTNIPGVDLGYDSSPEQATRALQVLNAGLTDKSSPDRVTFAKQVFTAGKVAEKNTDIFNGVYASDRPALVLGYSGVSGARSGETALASTTHAGYDDESGVHGVIKVTLGYRGSVDESLGNAYHELSHAINQGAFSPEIKNGEKYGEFGLKLTADSDRLVWGHGVEERSAVGSQSLGQMPFEVSEKAGVPIGWISENTFYQQRHLPASLYYPADTESKTTTATKTFHVAQENIPEDLKEVTFPVESDYFANQYDVFAYLNDVQTRLQRLRTYRDAIVWNKQLGIDDSKLPQITREYKSLKATVEAELPKLAEASALANFEHAKVHRLKIKTDVQTFKERSPESYLAPVYALAGAIGQQLEDVHDVKTFNQKTSEAVAKYYRPLFADDTGKAAEFDTAVGEYSPGLYRASHTTDLSSLRKPFGLFDQPYTESELRTYQAFAKSLGVASADTAIASAHDYTDLLKTLGAATHRDGSALTAKERAQRISTAVDDALAAVGDGGDATPLVKGLNDYLANATPESVKALNETAGVTQVLSQVYSLEGKQVVISAHERARFDSFVQSDEPIVTGVVFDKEKGPVFTDSSGKEVPDIASLEHVSRYGLIDGTSFVTGDNKGFQLDDGVVTKLKHYAQGQEDDFTDSAGEVPQATSNELSDLLRAVSVSDNGAAAETQFQRDIEGKPAGNNETDGASMSRPSARQAPADSYEGFERFVTGYLAKTPLTSEADVGNFYRALIKQYPQTPVDYVEKALQQSDSLRSSLEYAFPDLALKQALNTSRSQVRDLSQLRHIALTALAEMIDDSGLAKLSDAEIEDQLDLVNVDEFSDEDKVDYQRNVDLYHAATENRQQSIDQTTTAFGVLNQQRLEQNDLYSLAENKGRSIQDILGIVKSEKDTLGLSAEDITRLELLGGSDQYAVNNSAGVAAVLDKADLSTLSLDKQQAFQRARESVDTANQRLAQRLLTGEDIPNAFYTRDNLTEEAVASLQEQLATTQSRQESVNTTVAEALDAPTLLQLRAHGNSEAVLRDVVNRAGGAEVFSIQSQLEGLFGRESSESVANLSVKNFREIINGSVSAQLYDGADPIETRMGVPAALRQSIDRLQSYRENFSDPALFNQFAARWSQAVLDTSETILPLDPEHFGAEFPQTTLDTLNGYLEKKGAGIGIDTYDGDQAVLNKLEANAVSDSDAASNNAAAPLIQKTTDSPYGEYAASYIRQLKEAVATYRDPQLQNPSLDWLNKVGALDEFVDTGIAQVARDAAVGADSGHFRKGFGDDLVALRQRVESTIGEKLTLDIDTQPVIEQPAQSDPEADAVSLVQSIDKAVEYWQGLDHSYQISARNGLGITNEDIKYLSIARDAVNSDAAEVQSRAPHVFEIYNKLDRLASFVSSRDPSSDTPSNAIAWDTSLSRNLQVERVTNPGFEPLLIGRLHRVNDSTRAGRHAEKFNLSEDVIKSNVPNVLIGVNRTSSAEDALQVLRQGLGDGAHSDDGAFARRLVDTAEYAKPLTKNGTRQVYGTDESGIVFSTWHDDLRDLGISTNINSRVVSVTPDSQIVDISVPISGSVTKHLKQLDGELSHIQTQLTATSTDDGNFKVVLDGETIEWDKSTELKIERNSFSSTAASERGINLALPEGASFKDLAAARDYLAGIDSKIEHVRLLKAGLDLDANDASDNRAAIEAQLVKELSSLQQETPKIAEANAWLPYVELINPKTGKPAENTVLGTALVELRENARPDLAKYKGVLDVHEYTQFLNHSAAQIYRPLYPDLHGEYFTQVLDQHVPVLKRSPVAKDPLSSLVDAKAFTFSDTTVVRAKAIRAFAKSLGLSDSLEKTSVGTESDYAKLIREANGNSTDSVEQIDNTIRIIEAGNAAIAEFSQTGGDLTPFANALNGFLHNDATEIQRYIFGENGSVVSALDRLESVGGKALTIDATTRESLSQYLGSDANRALTLTGSEKGVFEFALEGGTRVKMPSPQGTQAYDLVDGSRFYPASEIDGKALVLNKALANRLNWLESPTLDADPTWVRYAFDFNAVQDTPETFATKLSSKIAQFDPDALATGGAVATDAFATLMLKTNRYVANLRSEAPEQVKGFYQALDRAYDGRLDQFYQSAASVSKFKGATLDKAFPDLALAAQLQESHQSVLQLESTQLAAQQGLAEITRQSDIASSATSAGVERAIAGFDPSTLTARQRTDFDTLLQLYRASTDAIASERQGLQTSLNRLTGQQAELLNARSTANLVDDVTRAAFEVGRSGESSKILTTERLRAAKVTDSAQQQFNVGTEASNVAVLERYLGEEQLGSFFENTGGAQHYSIQEQLGRLIEQNGAEAVSNMTPEQLGRIADVATAANIREGKSVAEAANGLVSELQSSVQNLDNLRSAFNGDDAAFDRFASRWSQTVLDTIPVAETYGADFGHGFNSATWKNLSGYLAQDRQELGDTYAHYQRLIDRQTPTSESSLPKRAFQNSSEDTFAVAEGAEVFTDYASGYLAELTDAVEAYRSPQGKSVDVAWLDKVAALDNYADGATLQFAREIAISRQLGHFSPDLPERLNRFRSGIESIIGHELSLGTDAREAPLRVPGNVPVEERLALTNAISKGLDYFNKLTPEQKAFALSGYRFSDRDADALRTLTNELGKSDAPLTSEAREAFGHLNKLDGVAIALDRQGTSPASADNLIPWSEDLTFNLSQQRLVADNFDLRIVGSGKTELINPSDASDGAHVQIDRTNIPGVSVGSDGSHESRSGALSLLQAGLDPKLPNEQSVFARQLATAASLAELHGNQLDSRFGAQREGIVVGLGEGSGQLVFSEKSSGETRSSAEITIDRNLPVSDQLSDLVGQLGRSITATSFASDGRSLSTLNKIQITPDKAVRFNEGIDERLTTGIGLAGDNPFNTRPADTPAGWINENSYRSAAGLPAKVALVPADANADNSSASSTFRISDTALSNSEANQALPKGAGFKSVADANRYLNDTQTRLNKIRVYRQALDDDGISEQLSVKARQGITKAIAREEGAVKKAVPKLAEATVWAGYRELLGDDYLSSADVIGRLEDTAVAVLQGLEQVDGFSGAGGLAGKYQKELKTRTLNAYKKAAAKDVDVDFFATAEDFFKQDLTSKISSSPQDLSAAGVPSGIVDAGIAPGRLESLEAFNRALGNPIEVRDTASGNKADFLRVIHAYDEQHSSDLSPEALAAAYTDAVNDALGATPSEGGDITPLAGAFADYLTKEAHPDKIAALSEHVGVIRELGKVVSVNGRQVHIDTDVRGQLIQTLDGAASEVTGARINAEGQFEFVTDAGGKIAGFDSATPYRTIRYGLFDGSQVVEGETGAGERVTLKLPKRFSNLERWLGSDDTGITDSRALQIPLVFVRDEDPGAFNQLVARKLAVFEKATDKPQVSSEVTRNLSVFLKDLAQYSRSSDPAIQQSLPELRSAIRETIGENHDKFFSDVLRDQPDVRAQLVDAFPEIALNASSYGLRTQVIHLGALLRSTIDTAYKVLGEQTPKGVSPDELIARLNDADTVALNPTELETFHRLVKSADNLTQTYNEQNTAFEDAVDRQGDVREEIMAIKDPQQQHARIQRFTEEQVNTNTTTLQRGYNSIVRNLDIAVFDAVDRSQAEVVETSLLAPVIDGVGGPSAFSLEAQLERRLSETGGDPISQDDIVDMLKFSTITKFEAGVEPETAVSEVYNDARKALYGAEGLANKFETRADFNTFAARLSQGVIDYVSDANKDNERIVLSIDAPDQTELSRRLLGGFRTISDESYQRSKALLARQKQLQANASDSEPQQSRQSNDKLMFATGSIDVDGEPVAFEVEPAVIGSDGNERGGIVRINAKSIEGKPLSPNSLDAFKAAANALLPDDQPVARIEIDNADSLSGDQRAVIESAMDDLGISVGYGQDEPDGQARVSYRSAALAEYQRAREAYLKQDILSRLKFSVRGDADNKLHVFIDASNLDPEEISGFALDRLATMIKKTVPENYRIADSHIVLSDGLGSEERLSIRNAADAAGLEAKHIVNRRLVRSTFDDVFADAPSGETPLTQLSAIVAHFDAQSTSRLQADTATSKGQESIELKPLSESNPTQQSSRARLNQLIIDATQEKKINNAKLRQQAEGLGERLQAGIDGLRAEEKLGTEWLPDFSSVKKLDDDTYRLTVFQKDTDETRVVTTTDRSFLEAREFIDDNVETVLKGFKADAAGGLVPREDVPEVEGINGLNAAFAIQSLVSYFQTKSAENLNTDKDVAEVLKAHEAINYARIAYGLAQDGYHAIGLARQLIKTGAEAAETAARSGSQAFTVAGMIVGGGIDVLLSLASAGFDIYELTKAQSDAEKAIYGSQLVLDTGSAILGGTSIGLGIAAAAGVTAAGTAASLIGGAGALVAGIGVGVAGLVQAFSQVSAEADQVAKYFSSVDTSYKNGGFDYKDDSDTLVPLSGSVVKSVNFRTGSVTFGTQKIHRTYGGSAHTKTGAGDGYLGVGPSVDYNSAHDLNVRELFHYGSKTALHNADAHVLVAPITPWASISQSYTNLPGSNTKHGKGYDVLRGAETKDFVYDYTVVVPPPVPIPLEFALNKIDMTYHQTGIDIILDEQNRVVVIPKIPDEYVGKVHHNIHGDGGQYVVSLNDRATVNTFNDGDKSSSWIIESGNVSGGNVSISDNSIRVGSASVNVHDHGKAGDSGVLLSDKHSDVYDINFDSHLALALILQGEILDDDRKPSGTARSDIEGLLKRLSSAGQLLPYTKISHFHDATGKVHDQAVYDKADKLFVYSDDLPETAEFVNVTQAHNDMPRVAIYIDRKTRQVIEINTESHKQYRAFTLPLLEGDVRIGAVDDSAGLIVQMQQTLASGESASYVFRYLNGDYVLSSINGDDALYTALTADRTNAQDHLADRFGSAVVLDDVVRIGQQGKTPIFLDGGDGRVQIAHIDGASDELIQIVHKYKTSVDGNIVIGDSTQTKKTADTASNVPVNSTDAAPVLFYDPHVGKAYKQVGENPAQQITLGIDHSDIAQHIEKASNTTRGFIVTGDDGLSWNIDESGRSHLIDVDADWVHKHANWLGDFKKLVSSLNAANPPVSGDLLPFGAQQSKNIERIALHGVTQMSEDGHVEKLAAWYDNLGKNFVLADPLSDGGDISESLSLVNVSNEGKTAWLYDVASKTLYRQNLESDNYGLVRKSVSVLTGYIPADFRSSPAGLLVRDTQGIFFDLGQHSETVVGLNQDWIDQHTGDAEQALEKLRRKFHLADAVAVYPDESGDQVPQSWLVPDTMQQLNLNDLPSKFLSENLQLLGIDGANHRGYITTGYGEQTQLLSVGLKAFEPDPSDSQPPTASQQASETPNIGSPRRYDFARTVTANDGSKTLLLQAHEGTAINHLPLLDGVNNVIVTLPFEQNVETAFSDKFLAHYQRVSLVADQNEGVVTDKAQPMVIDLGRNLDVDNTLVVQQGDALTLFDQTTQHSLSFNGIFDESGKRIEHSAVLKIQGEKPLNLSAITNDLADDKASDSAHLRSLHLRDVYVDQALAEKVSDHSTLNKIAQAMASFQQKEAADIASDKNNPLGNQPPSISDDPHLDSDRNDL
ncbi:Toxin B [BD1-7 clade bacterium]|uniref:Toxin B n=1 Tax=BD1-7 clade bacterium TaxID=2029982 RepID=A0A5S9QJY3_9GAMM|nr:Toxin B [BD1-7 clade bacterium]